MWDVASETELLRLCDHSAYVVSVWFSPDGARVISASKDNTIVLWDIKTQSKLLSFRHEKGSKLTDAALSPDGRTVTSTAEDGQIHYWDTDIDFAVWLGVQAFLSLVRRHGQDRRLYTDALKRLRECNPLIFGRHSTIRPRSLLAYIIGQTAAPGDMETAFRGLLEGYRQPVDLFVDDGPTVLDLAIANRSRVCTEMLVENLRHHPPSLSRTAWTRALPALAATFPDLVTPLLKRALMPSLIQTCRAAELDERELVVVECDSAEPPPKFALLESHGVRIV